MKKGFSQTNSESVSNQFHVNQRVIQREKKQEEWICETLEFHSVDVQRLAMSSLTFKASCYIIILWCYFLKM